MGCDLALLRHCLKIGKRNVLRMLHEPADAQSIVGKATSQERVVLGRIRQKVVVRPEMRGDFHFRELAGGIPPFDEFLKPPMLNRPVFYTRRACLMVKGVAANHAAISTAMARRKNGRPDQEALSTPANM
jgi:hypothetical protein